MDTFGQFRAVHTSGLIVPRQAEVAALALLFEKTYLPRNLELVVQFSKAFRFRDIPDPREVDIRLQLESGDAVRADCCQIGFDEGPDPLRDLSPEERRTAEYYLLAGTQFCYRNQCLFGEVFETNAFIGGDPLKVELLEQRLPSGKNTYRVTFQPLEMTEDDLDEIPRRLDLGYVPVTTSSRGTNIPVAQATQLAALLGMQAVEIVLPPTKAAHPEVILEARHRLKDHLPPFWSSMLKLSVDLRRMSKEGVSAEKLSDEARFLVDAVVRPALIDLRGKLEKERKDWFFRILSPIQKGVRLLVGNPPLTQQQLLTSALVLASDVAMSAAENMRTIDALKREAGLTFLLELSEVMQGQSVTGRGDR